MFIKTMAGMALVAGLMLAGHAHAGVAYDTSLAAPGFYSGSGNPNDHWVTDTDNGVELGLQTLIRYTGPAVSPSPGGSATYHVDLGLAPSPHTGGLWNFSFSFNGSDGGLTLSDITTKLTMTDFGHHSTGSFDALLIADNDRYGPNGENSGLDDATTQFGFQNSETLSFAGIAAGLGELGYDPFENDTYRFTFTAMQGDTVLASVSETVIAGTGAVPEPGTLSVLAVGCLGLLRARRRRSA